MSGRLPFFERVDEVLSLLEEYRREKPRFTLQQTSSQPEAALARAQAQAWEPVVIKLTAFDLAVLEYVAAMLKTRENLVGRRVSSILGPSRGNGMLGVLLSAFALATVFNFLATMLPAVPKIWFLAGFLLSVGYVAFLGFAFLRVGHDASQLLTYVSLLEAVIALKKAEPTGLTAPLELTAPAQVVRPTAQEQVEQV